MLCLLASLLFTNPTPLDMPRAEAYLVKEGKRLYLEDRYDAFDLWVSRSVMGRWEDDDGRVFTLAALDTEPPPEGTRRIQSRVDYTAACRPVPRRGDVRRAVELLSPCPVAEEPRRSRQLPHGFKDVVYWQLPTNYSAIVCAFRPEKIARWHLATWQLAEGDDYPERVQAFEREFFDAMRWRAPSFPDGVRETVFAEKLPPPPSGEREQLRADARHSVTNYANWRVTDAPTFTVLDDMSNGRDFIMALTNELTQMRTRYAAALPTKLDGTNTLCVARIFASREEYLDAVDESMRWSAACWCPSRREIIAYLPTGGEKELLRTVRHEAFHQYLSYAASMIPVSPWLNEGYAQYFEDEKNEKWGEEHDVSPEGLEQLSGLLPSVFLMDYEAFYAGTDAERRLKYRLAWSIAVFLEKGADDVRFQPFKRLKADYLDALLEHRDMTKATAAAFKNADLMKLFVREWKKFWKDR